MSLADLLQAAAEFQIRFAYRSDAELAALRKEHWERVAQEIARLIEAREAKPRKRA